MRHKLYEWFSIQRAKNPGTIVLGTILIFNLILFLAAAFVISSFSLSGTERMGFIEAAFCTVAMILDAGCIQFVISDIGEASVAATIVCLIIILIGMISFTGAVIGYVTNYISKFIENANANTKKLRLTGHVVILNWNTRASEIINDLMYSDTREKVVVLSDSKRTGIELEINERLADTVARENAEIWDKVKNKPFLSRYLSFRKKRFKNRVTVLIREGDVFSSKQLHDISLEYAKSIIILGNDISNSVCKLGVREQLEDNNRGNSQTVKTLMQVADITSASYSSDKQKIVVEITDNWTGDLVDKIIEAKQVNGKCNIVPVRINLVLGQILSQFSLMPELNLAYKELFSNKGMAFYTREVMLEDSQMEITDYSYIPEYMKNHTCAIPLTIMKTDQNERLGDTRPHAFVYYASNEEKDIQKKSIPVSTGYSVDLNQNYWIEKKNVIILGHNTKCANIMEGFRSFVGEWNSRDEDSDILTIMVIDDEKNLEKMKGYQDYPFVKETIKATLYDRETICSSIERFVDAHDGDTSILILSDDSATSENIDASALANLVYVQDIIKRKKRENPDFDMGSMDIIVEIIDPKHHDIVSSYSVNNVVISNRYISKMITQIGQKEALFDFYTDILKYDTDSASFYTSKEIYAKRVGSLFNKVPEKCSAAEFIRAVYDASFHMNESLPPEKRIETIALGYVKPDGQLILFNGDQNDMEVDLSADDKLIVFSNH